MSAKASHNPAGPSPRQSSGFIECSVWGDQAQNVADSLHEGDRVTVTGRFVTRVFTPEQGRNAGHEVR